MWSKTYYSFKYESFLKTLTFSLISVIKNFLLGFFIGMYNPKKGKIYFLRTSGSFNALIGKKSWYRPNLMSRELN